MTQYDSSLVWFRRDLRAHDHAALYTALKTSRRVFCCFVFDTEILDKLPGRADRRVEFIWHSIAELKQAFEAMGGGLVVRHGCARDEIPQLAAQLEVDAVWVNHDYEPAAVVRDQAVERALGEQGIAFLTCKDQVIFEKDEILTRNSGPFTVFTPYKNAWLKKLEPFFLRAYPVDNYRKHLAAPPAAVLPTLPDLGFQKTNLLGLGLPPGMSGARRLLEAFKARMTHYHEWRDYPALEGTSHLSAHLRFGTVSVRALAREAYLDASRGAQAWLNELVWRDFYFMILHHNPRVVEHAFRREYDALEFSNDKNFFAAWCEARTGYPLVDAAMRQINQTGYMHNRLRMVAASFLVKDLHVDWRWGERYFADHLNDYDLAANNGGWQWAASTGCDAQPYFRIFNPVTQSQKFDPAGKFIRKYVPELAGCSDKFIHMPWLMTPEQQNQAGVTVGKDYPAPVVDHAVARQRTLEIYRRAKNG